jgi:hypothetical protein
MAVDWNLIFKNAVDAAVATSKKDEPAIRAYLKDIQGQHEEALKSIALAFATGDIDKATFDSSLEDEAETLKNEMLVVTVVAKATAQRVANSFVSALETGLKAALVAAL